MRRPDGQGSTESLRPGSTGGGARDVGSQSLSQRDCRGRTYRRRRWDCAPRVGNQRQRSLSRMLEHSEKNPNKFLGERVFGSRNRPASREGLEGVEGRRERYRAGVGGRCPGMCPTREGPGEQRVGGLSLGQLEISGDVASCLQGRRG